MQKLISFFSNMNNDSKLNRYNKKVRYIEYEHTLLLFSEDISNIFNIEHNEHIHWFIEDILPSAEQNGYTRATCADDRTGKIIFQEMFVERYNSEPEEIDNNFYALVMTYVNTLGYDLGPLVVDIQTPKSAMESFNGALLRLVWTTFE